MHPADRKKPAIYLISVRGRLEPDWSEYLGGIIITVNDNGPYTTTTLCGELIDQAALMGVLNNLYGLGLHILDVKHQEINMEVNR